ncbi:hypothetical protein FS749_011438 [Ceratobasidium sp. UAMH 11750]|nr:hypothetical protein FS749_011438 [Ceratobasidium sp. UAMH 11750]
MPGMTSFGCWAYAGAEERVARADLFMRQYGFSGLTDLSQGLREYEDLPAPEAPQLTDVQLASWHPAAVHTLGLSGIATPDCDYSFPQAWIDRKASGHSRWSIPALSHWLQSGALQTPAGVLMIGLHGVSTGYLALPNETSSSNATIKYSPSTTCASLVDVSFDCRSCFVSRAASSRPL